LTTGSTVREREYTLLCPFGGLGAGALGFLQARVDELVGASGRFRLIGGIDSDNEACKEVPGLRGAAGQRGSSLNGCFAIALRANSSRSSAFGCT
jgi:hypothetical protein